MRLALQLNGLARRFGCASSPNQEKQDGGNQGRSPNFSGKLLPLARPSVDSWWSPDPRVVKPWFPANLDFHSAGGLARFEFPMCEADASTFLEIRSFAAFRYTRDKI